MHPTVKTILLAFHLGSILEYKRNKAVVYVARGTSHYRTLRETAKAWGFSRRYVVLCIKAGHVPGTVRIGSRWLVPRDAAKPDDKRCTKEAPEASAQGECSSGPGHPARKGWGGVFARTVAVVLCLGVLLVSAIQVAGTLAGRAAARQEYDGLREQYAPSARGEDGSAGLKASTLPSESELSKDPREVNPDYVGWLQIAGTAVDYPVARGADNVKYLNTTFQGNPNAAGAIFMDCGNVEGFTARHTVLYGHNMKNGSMFGELRRYLAADFLAEHPTITVTLPDGTAQMYTIFAVVKTDAYSAAYRLDFTNDADFAAFAAGLGAPEGTTQLLTLSTCTNGENDDERILIHAALAR